MTRRILPLTDAESSWIKKLKRVLAECPSDRIASYTIGDSDITLYDNSFQSEINALLDSGRTDHSAAVDALDCELAHIPFPFPVHSVAG